VELREYEGVVELPQLGVSDSLRDNAALIIRPRRGRLNLHGCRCGYLHFFFFLVGRFAAYNSAQHGLQFRYSLSQLELSLANWLSTRRLLQR
jgi:hypothetical protein